MFLYGKRIITIFVVIMIAQLTIICGVRIALLFTPAALFIYVAFNLLAVNRRYLDVARALNKPPRVSDASEGETNTDASSHAGTDLSTVVRWARVYRSLPVVYACVFILGSIEMCFLLQSHHPMQSLVISAITAVPVLMLVRILTAVAHPSQVIELECIRAVRRPGLDGILPLISAGRYLRESIRPEADARLTALLNRLATDHESQEERTVLLQLARELPRLSPDCRLAAFGFFERSGATCVLPLVNAYLRKLRRGNEAPELIRAAEHCVTVLQQLAASGSHRETLLRSGKSQEDNANLLRPEGNTKKEEELLKPLSTTSEPEVRH